MYWKIYVDLQVIGNNHNQAAATGRPLTGSILCEGRLCPHLGEQTDQRCELNPRSTSEFYSKLNN